MSHVVCYLANKKDLQNLLEQYPEKIKYYIKYGAFVGDSDAVDYINEQIKSYNDSPVQYIRHTNKGVEK